MDKLLPPSFNFVLKDVVLKKHPWIRFFPLVCPLSACVYWWEIWKENIKKKKRKKVLNISQTVLWTLLQRWKLICSYFPLLYADADFGGFVCSAFLISNLPFQLWLAPRFLHLLYIIQDPEVQIIIHFYLNLFAQCYLYPDLLHTCVEDTICFLKWKMRQNPIKVTSASVMSKNSLKGQQK